MNDLAREKLEQKTKENLIAIILEQQKTIEDFIDNEYRTLNRQWDFLNSQFPQDGQATYKKVQGLLSRKSESEALDPQSFVEDVAQ